MEGRGLRCNAGKKVHCREKVRVAIKGSLLEKGKRERTRNAGRNDLFLRSPCFQKRARDLRRLLATSGNVAQKRVRVAIDAGEAVIARGEKERGMFTDMVREGKGGTMEISIPERRKLNSAS